MPAVSSPMAIHVQSISHRAQASGLLRCARNDDKRLVTAMIPDNRKPL
jgi:hypothetical protein